MQLCHKGNLKKKMIFDLDQNVKIVVGQLFLKSACLPQSTLSQPIPLSHLVPINLRLIKSSFEQGFKLS